MTPQQKKADELVERFRKYAKIGTDSPVTGRTENAIQCAIICVEEILDARPCVISSNFVRGFEMTSNSGYWQSVLNELKSMV